ncbi:MAG: R3H domain-containing nucleic acid-binding protein [Acidobacteriota bacterium]
MHRQFFSGKSLEQAVMAAARHFGVEPEQVAYKARDKKHGFLSARRRVVIEVDTANPILTEEQIAEAASRKDEAATPEPPQRSSEPRPESRPARAPERSADSRAEPPRQRDRRDRDEASEASSDIFEVHWDDLDIEAFEVDDEVGPRISAFEHAVDLTLDVMDLEIEYTVSDGEVVEIEFAGDDQDLLLEDDGKVLKALEHVLPKIVKGLIGEAILCKADCEGFQAQHEEDLRELANEAAGEVRQNGRSRLLAPMNPSDRRIVHLALASDPDVETFSEGRGFMKRVRIAPIDE